MQLKPATGCALSCTPRNRRAAELASPKNENGTAPASTVKADNMVDRALSGVHDFVLSFSKNWKCTYIGYPENTMNSDDVPRRSSSRENIE